MLKQTLDQDLKSAMLAGNKAVVSALRNIKSAIQYAEVDLRSKGIQQISDDQLVAVLSKEAKKRQEAADLYKKAGQPDRANAELSEKDIIDKYLPKQVTKDEISDFVNSLIKDLGTAASLKGQIIGATIKHFGNSAEGSLIAQIVSESLDKA